MATGGTGTPGSTYSLPARTEKRLQPRDSDLLTATAALRPEAQQAVREVGAGIDHLRETHRRAKTAKINVRIFCGGESFLLSWTRCDFLLRVPQISLGNIYEKCQGEAGGWRSPLPSSTWLSTPNSSLTSLCVCVLVSVCGCVSVREVKCPARASRGN